MGLLEDIRAFEPANEQERVDRLLMLGALAGEGDPFVRTQVPHFTASAWAVDPTFTQTVAVYHNLYDSWSWVGGHADGERELARVAARELAEETGVRDARLVPLPGSPILSLEAMTVDGHEKRGAYVSPHIHYNVTYLFVADLATPLAIAPEENSAVAWMPIDELIARSTEPWVRDRIYRKLAAKTAALAGRFAAGAAAFEG
jgi:8-oxo-dGTP pyrophosphatase MutT (NUDIX family)